MELACTKNGITRVFDFISHILLSRRARRLSTHKKTKQKQHGARHTWIHLPLPVFCSFDSQGPALRGRSFYFSDITSVWVEKNWGQSKDGGIYTHNTHMGLGLAFFRRFSRFGLVESFLQWFFGSLIAAAASTEQYRSWEGGGGAGGFLCRQIAATDSTEL